MVGKILNSPMPAENLRNIDKKIIPPEKIEEILNELRKVL